MYGHPMQAQLGQGPQLGFNLDEMIDRVIQNIKQSGQAGIDQAKYQAISTGTMTLLNDPKVQTALKTTGEQTAAQKIAESLLSTYRATGNFVVENPWKSTAIVVGGAVVVGGILYLLLKR